MTGMLLSKRSGLNWKSMKGTMIFFRSALCNFDIFRALLRNKLIPPDKVDEMLLIVKSVSRSFNIT